MEKETTEKKTRLYERHLAAGGKMAPFAGFSMPIQYAAGILAEHMAVRKTAGLFDVSHMGEFIVKGRDALQNLQRLLTNDLSSMSDGQVKYSPMCNERGGVTDDLIIYRFSDTEYMAVVNAVNRDKDWDWMTGRAAGDCVYTDASDGLSLLALQGPLAVRVLAKLIGNVQSIPDKYYTFTRRASLAGKDIILSRTGYTGEDGFEIYAENEHAQDLWDAIIDAGGGDGLIPCGLGARDTLRLEAAMPLYGHELDEDHTPMEAGLSAFVKLDKGDFVGRQALMERGTPDVRRAGILFDGRGIVRENVPIYTEGGSAGVNVSGGGSAGGNVSGSGSGSVCGNVSGSGSDNGGAEAGITTSGTFLPYINRPGAMAYLRKESAKPGTAVYASVRGRIIPGEVVKLPFYKRIK